MKKHWIALYMLGELSRISSHTSYATRLGQRSCQCTERICLECYCIFPADIIILRENKGLPSYQRLNFNDSCSWTHIYKKTLSPRPTDNLPRQPHLNRLPCFQPLMFRALRFHHCNLPHTQRCNTKHSPPRAKPSDISQIQINSSTRHANKFHGIKDWSIIAVF